MGISCQQPTSTTNDKDFALEALIREAQEAEMERRAQGRVPFFHPAMISSDGEDQGKAAFTRDIAHNGIGLLHAYPIHPQSLNVDLNVSDGGQVRLEVEILWCVPCGDGWYISGGDIINGTVAK